MKTQHMVRIYDRPTRSYKHFVVGYSNGRISSVKKVDMRTVMVGIRKKLYQLGKLLVPTSKDSQKRRVLIVTTLFGLAALIVALAELWKAYNAEPDVVTVTQYKISPKLFKLAAELREAADIVETTGDTTAAREVLDVAKLTLKEFSAWYNSTDPNKPYLEF